MSAGTALLDLLFPPKCPFCHRVLERPRDPLCPVCQEILPWLEGKAGERAIEFADGCYSPLAYRDGVVDAIRRYKFERTRAYCVPLGALMAQCLRDRLPDGADRITWAPLSKKRLRQRGFDQAGLLARVAGEGLSIPVVPALEKARHTQPQSGLEEDAARRANALGAYRLLPGGDMAGKRVVLVDDIGTSGSTLAECARLLREGGAAAVFCLTLAQARGDR